MVKFAGNRKMMYLIIMAKTTILKVPFFVIAFDLKRLFSVEDEKGIGTLPVFTEAEAAEKYRRCFARNFKIKLQVCVADKIEKGLNLVECASLACRTLQYVVINPLPPPQEAEQPRQKQIQTVIKSLQDQYRRQKARSLQNPRKK
jgi:hypothetical protein